MKKIIVSIFVLAGIFIALLFVKRDALLSLTSNPTALSTQSNKTHWTPLNNTEDTEETFDPAYCKSFNTDQPTASVDFSDQASGFSVTLPYNPNWGNDRYTVDPYNFDMGILYYGPISCGQGDFGRYQQIHVLPHRTESAYQNELSKREDVRDVKVEQISNGMTLLEFQITGGFCSGKTAYVIGISHDYDLTNGGCSPIDPNILRSLRVF